MSYIRLSDGHYPVTLDAIRQANPNTGIPDDPTDASLNPLGYAVVTTATKPTTTAGQVAELATTPDSNNTLQWTVRSLTSAEIARHKSNLVTQINDAAENARSRYVTPGSGQAMTYLQKVSEAKAYQAATSPTATNYPLINAEANAIGLTIANVASKIVATDKQWTTLAANIEGARQGGNAKVKAAATASAALTAANAAMSTLQSI